MRTLKKSLCLVLALVMVLGLFVMGSNAAYTPYGDEADVNYLDAVQVLTGLGVVEGRTDGNFDPKATVTRAEACAMIARMMLGREGADRLPVGDVKFSDVSLESWEGRMAKYIAFCANRGIVVGMGDGTFHPTEPVTGTQLATMLLRALGYGAIGEYEGKGWDINAVADALYYKIFEDTEVTDFSKEASREETALYIWNTMRVELVGWDVDRNYYDGKRITFAGDVFGVEWFIAQITANQASGADYTVIEEAVERTDRRGRVIYDEHGDPVIDYVPVYFDYETGKDLIAHEVMIYYKADVSYKDKNNTEYFKAFLMQDVSTVVNPGRYVGDTYKFLMNANKNNKNASLEFDVWINYVYDVTADTSALTMSAALGPKYNKVVDMQGDNVKSTRSLSEIILDHNGYLLAYMVLDYQVDQVKKVTEDGYVLKQDKYKMDTYDTKYAYGEFAKGDYVTVQPVGTICELYPCTTSEVSVFDREVSTDLGTPVFNQYTINPGPGYQNGLTIPDTEDAMTVNAGDKVLFYLDYYGNYFAAHVMERGVLKGVVFVNAAFLKEGAADKYGKKDESVYVQCVDEDGKEAIYQLNSTYTATNMPKQGVYKVFTDSKDVATLIEAGAVASKAKDKTTFAQKGDSIYYVSSDTKVYYVKDELKDMKVSKSSVLAEGAYDVYVYASGANGSYNIVTAWVVDPSVKAPNIDGSYMYISGFYFLKDFSAAYAQNSGSQVINDETSYYYMTYIDGTPNYAAFIVAADQEKKALSDFYGMEKTIEASGDVETYYVKSGWYTYSHDDFGRYDLEPLENSTVLEKRDRITLTSKNLVNGKLYLSDIDGKATSAKVLNISYATDAAGKNYLTLNSLDDIEDFLNETKGNSVTVSYLAVKVGDDWIPTGTIYVNSATDKDTP